MKWKEMKRNETNIFESREANTRRDRTWSYRMYFSIKIAPKRSVRIQRGKFIFQPSLVPFQKSEIYSPTLCQYIQKKYRNLTILLLKT